MINRNPLAIAGAVLFLMASSPAQPAVVSPTGEVSGLVFDAVSSRPVEGAQVILLETRLGTRTSADGHFRVVERPGADWAGVIEVRHPCFHTVRIEVERNNLQDPLVLGLPFAQPRSADGTITMQCRAYGPNE
jgi:hypothetical protein